MTKYICLSLLGLLTILTHGRIFAHDTAPMAAVKDRPILTELLAFSKSNEGESITHKKLSFPPSGCTKAQFRQIIMLLNNLLACGSTAITAAGTISAPGVYCLANDVTGDFTITTDHVLFDLNGHTIFGGITVRNGITALSNIIIRNGTLQDSSANGIFINGFPFNNHENIILENLTIDNPTNDGISITYTTLLQINNVLINGNGTANGNGINMIQATFISIQNATISNFLGTGINSNTSSQLFIGNSIVYNCSVSGFWITATFCQIINCIADNNGERGFYTLGGGPGIISNCIARKHGDNGIRIDSSSIWEILGCQMFNNTTDGLFVRPGSQILVKECQSAYNSGHGFNISSGTTGSIEGCSAISNNLNGFNDLGTTVNYVSNFAADNAGSNYSALPAPFVPATVATATSYWINAIGN